MCRPRPPGRVCLRQQRRRGARHWRRAEKLRAGCDPRASATPTGQPPDRPRRSLPPTRGALLKLPLRQTPLPPPDLERAAEVSFAPARSFCCLGEKARPRERVENPTLVNSAAPGPQMLSIGVQTHFASPFQQSLGERGHFRTARIEPLRGKILVDPQRERVPLLALANGAQLSSNDLLRSRRKVGKVSFPLERDTLLRKRQRE